MKISIDRGMVVARVYYVKGFPGGIVVKNPLANAGDARNMGSEDPLE